MQKTRHSFQMVEEPFQFFERTSKRHRRESTEEPECDVIRKARKEVVINRADGKHRAAAKKKPPHGHGHRAGNYDRNERTRPKFEKKQLEREQHSGDGRVE